MAAKKPTPDATAADPMVDTGLTPENTPVPGAGRWRWDDANSGWVDVDAPAPAPDTQTVQLPE
ncbi:hypothetical protein [Rhodoferax sp.]|uniref:hypothetical protein n=1 Tax=Rhodoferax sp. TaxID=50421 RepID=UPI0026020F73|nr:hypothetical protein [Rhodoferax sp.]MDD5479649.1 hypothetical protein [Rhodoferax sp.]